MSIVDTFSASLLRTQPANASVRLKSRPSQITPTYSIVIPALNEEECLPRLIDEIEAVMRGQFFEVVFVDDGSTDATWNVIRSAIARHRNWQAVRLTRPFGHQAALLAGMRAARGRAIISLDADGQHPADQLGRMIEEWKAGAKVVQMIRETDQNLPWFKRLTSKVFYRVFSTVCDVSIRNAASDFRLVDRTVADAILDQDAPTPFFRGLIPWLGFHTVELEYVARARLAGHSKYSLKAMTKLAVGGLMNFSLAPLRIAMFTGLIVAVLGFAYLCFATVSGLIGSGAISSWRVVAGLIAVFGGAQLFTMGLIGEYIGRLYHAHLARPSYVVAERTGLNRKRETPNSAEEGELERRGRKRSESVRLITAHIGEAEESFVPSDRTTPDRSRIDVLSRIETMRREEAAHAPLST